VVATPRSSCSVSRPLDGILVKRAATTAEQTPKRRERPDRAGRPSRGLGRRRGLTCLERSSTPEASATLRRTTIEPRPMESAPDGSNCETAADDTMRLIIGACVLIAVLGVRHTVVRNRLLRRGFRPSCKMNRSCKTNTVSHEPLQTFHGGAFVAGGFSACWPVACLSVGVEDSVISLGRFGRVLIQRREVNTVKVFRTWVSYTTFFDSADGQYSGLWFRSFGTPHVNLMRQLGWPVTLG
jgi:hypothetical protein